MFQAKARQHTYPVVQFLRSRAPPSGMKRKIDTPKFDEGQSQQNLRGYSIKALPQV